MTTDETNNLEFQNQPSQVKTIRTKHAASIMIGDYEVLAAVTPDGLRLLSERGVTRLFGSKRGGSHWRRSKGDEVVQNLPPFLSANNLRPYVLRDEVLVKGLANRIPFSGPGGRGNGIEATLLPRICDALLRARDDKASLPSQIHVIVTADLLMRGLAHIGIIRLVDEGTGYQSDLAKETLEGILRQFISEELSSWATTFSNDFYRELFRLRDITYDEFSNKRPQYIGHITNDIVYSRMAPKVLERLREVAPKNAAGHRKYQLYQNLRDPGYRRLVEHLAKITALMQVSTSWNQFYARLNQVAPKFDSSLALQLLEAE